MESLILKRIAGLITAHAGLRIREADYAQLSETLWQRAKGCGLRSLEAYYSLLMHELETEEDLFLSPASAQFTAFPKLEWHRLFNQLTVNESYFFRDRNQFQLISQSILPELIERKQQDHARHALSGLPSLRIWSAGCSTGEEAYSIAIALNELNFPWQEWNTFILGTDISVAALSTAQQGRYGNWSFRQTDPILQSRYFQVHQQGFQIREEVRRRVIFQYGNLIKDSFPTLASPLQAFDLILCRNVFIYFDSAAIAHTLDKFRRALAPKGYLITGHTELYGQDTSQFHLKIFPESLVYQCRSDSTRIPPTGSTSNPALQPQSAAPVKISSLPPEASAQSIPCATAAIAPLRPSAPEKNRPSSAPPIADAIAEAEASLNSKNYEETIRLATRLCSENPQQLAGHAILAKAYANIGNHSRAKECCKQALRLQPLNVDLHYLLAQIAEEEGDLDLAKEHLRRIIYIDTYAFKAYLDLASLYQQESNWEQAVKMERLALKTLMLLPEKTVIDPETGATVMDLRQHLEKKLDSNF